MQVWEGLNAVKFGRTLMGETDPEVSAPGTIRGDLRIHIRYSILHASDSKETADREINLWFGNNAINASINEDKNN